MEIILLRHGKPDIELKGHFNASEIKRLTVAYAESSIQDFPPQELINSFNTCYVVCSDLTRSLHTAEKLGIKQIHLSDNLFAETDLPHFDNSIIKMPTVMWVTVLRIMWLFGFKKNGESFSQAKDRAKQASNKLIRLAEENEKVILVGHGLMNRLIAKQLKLNNWQGPSSPSNKYWQYSVYTR